ncbi:MAG: hypothetical protein EP347_00925 [Alphaproteobacteria bacterium]|nr:MAG: hypothetical protein EP347_00925 [Alphaproteobacteria bacterium]
MPKLRMTLFGSLGAAAEDETPLPLGGKKTNALLAYLAAAPGKPHRREALAELLWPERFEKQSQQSFRQALSSARKMLGDAGSLLRDTEEGALTLDAAEVTTDIGDFERLCASPHLEDKKIACDLYTGDFLASLGPISEEYDRWLLQTRTHLKALAVELFEETAKAQQSAAQLDDAIETARRLVEIDPAHEEGHRVLIRLYLAKGQRSAAFRQYEACRIALSQHLDTNPGAETEQLLAIIKSETETAPATAQTSPAPAAPARASSPEPQAPPVEDTKPAAPTHLMTRGRWAVLAALIIVAGVWGLQSLVRTPSRPDAARTMASLPNDMETAPLTCGAPRELTEAGKPTLLLLPTHTFSEDKDIQLFGQSTTEAIQAMSSVLTDLTLVAGPRVGHPDRDLAPTELARKNAATQIFETTLRPEADGYRITMRIVDGASGQQIWQSTFTEQDPLADAGHLQNEIAMRAAWGIQEQITEGAQALFHRQYEPGSFEVFEHVTRGFGYLGEIKPIYNDLARKEFLTALELDANNPSAHAGLGFSYISPLIFRWQTGHPGDLALAEQQANLAAALDPAYAPAQNLQALLLLFKGDHDTARSKIDKGLLLSGSGADSTAFGGFVYSYTDNPRRALELATRALILRPYGTPTWYQWSYARALRVSGDPQGAINCLKQVDFQKTGTIAPALEMILAYDTLGTELESKPFVDLIMDRSGGAFSSADYCSSPTYSDPATTKACQSALERAGLP